MMKYEVYKEGEPIKTFYTGDDVLKYIDDNHYKIYTMFCGGYDFL